MFRIWLHRLIDVLTTPIITFAGMAATGAAAEPPPRAHYVRSIRPLLGVAAAIALLICGLAAFPSESAPPTGGLSRMSFPVVYKPLPPNWRISPPTPTR